MADALLIDAPVGGWSGGWGTLDDIASPVQVYQPEEGELPAASPVAMSHLLRLSEDFVAGDSPKVSPAPLALKAKRTKRAKSPLAEATADQLNRRLRLGTVSRETVERERDDACRHAAERKTEADGCAAEAEAEAESESATDPLTDKSVAAKEGADEAHTTPVKEQPGQEQQADEQLEEPSAHVAKYMGEVESAQMARKALDKRYQAPIRPGSAGAITEFSIPIDSTPWAMDSTELLAQEMEEQERSAARALLSVHCRSRGCAAPHTPPASESAPHLTSPTLSGGPRSPENSAETPPVRTVTDGRRSAGLARPNSRGSTMQSPAALASQAVASALGRLDIERPNSREAVAVAKEVRGEMNRWLRNVDTSMPHRQASARAKTLVLHRLGKNLNFAFKCLDFVLKMFDFRLKLLSFADCAPPPVAQRESVQQRGWAPLERRELEREDRRELEREDRRSLTPGSYPSLSLARERQR